MKKWLVVVGLVSVLVIAGTAWVAWNAPERLADSNRQIPVYVLSIESDGDSESVSSRLEGDRMRDHILILINDNPVSFFSWGSKFKEINQYLKPGQNTISITGDLSRQFWIEVGLYERTEINGSVQQKQTATLLEELIEPQAQEGQWEKDFTADIAYTLPIFESENLISQDPNDAKEQILTYLKNLHDTLGKHDAAEIKRLSLESGSVLWQKMVYGQTEKEIDELVKVSLKLLQKQEYPALDADSIHLIFGPNLVMAYAGFEEEGLNSAYLWPVFWEKQKINMPPHILACINGRWVIWE